MFESKVAVLEWDEVNAMAQQFAQKHSCIRQGTAYINHGYVNFAFLVKEDKKEEESFFKLMQPFDTAGFWETLPDRTKSGWITLPEDMTRRVMDSVSDLSFTIGSIVFYGDGVLLFERVKDSFT